MCHLSLSAPGCSFFQVANCVRHSIRSSFQVHLMTGYNSMYIYIYIILSYVNLICSNQVGCSQPLMIIGLSM